MLFLCAGSSAVGATLLYGAGGELEEASRVCACHAASLLATGEPGSCAANTKGTEPRMPARRTQEGFHNVALAAPPPMEMHGPGGAPKFHDVQGRPAAAPPSGGVRLLTPNPNKEAQMQRNARVRNGPLPGSDKDPKGEQEVLDELLELFPKAHMPTLVVNNGFIESARVQYAMCRGVAGLSQDTCLSRTKRLVRSTFHITLASGAAATGLLVYDERLGDQGYGVAITAHLTTGRSHADLRGTMTNGSTTLPIDFVAYQVVPHPCPFQVSSDCLSKLARLATKDVGLIPVEASQLSDETKNAAWSVDAFQPGARFGSDVLVYGNHRGAPTTVTGSVERLERVVFVEGAERVGGRLRGDVAVWTVPEAFQRVFDADSDLVRRKWGGLSGGPMVPFDLSAPLGLVYIEIPPMVVTDKANKVIVGTYPVLSVLRPSVIQERIRSSGETLHGRPPRGISDQP